MSPSRSFTPGAFVCLALLAPAAGAGDVLAVRLAGIEPGQVREARFHLDRDLDVDIEGIGAGAPGSLYAYGWLLDLDAMKPVWSMTDAHPARTRSREEQVFRERRSLPAGRYALLYYRAESRFQTGGPLLLRGLMGRHGQAPQDLEIALRIAARDLAGFELAPAMEPPPPGELRLAPLGDSAFVRRRFRLRSPSRVSVLALGEGLRGRALADRSFLLELETRKAVWQSTRDSSESAGGTRKNRLSRVALDLEPGGYELVAITDDSHAWLAWNAPPPFAPHAWGITLRAPPDALDERDVPEERLIVRLTGAGNDQELSATFRLATRTPLRVYSMGEWSSGAGRLVDHGWIEDDPRGKVVWQMDYESSYPAGGAGKNRAVDTSLTLEPGTYRVRYQTDDSHCPGHWNGPPPDDASSWGITVSTFRPEARFELLEQTARPRVEKER